MGSTKVDKKEKKKEKREKHEKTTEDGVKKPKSEKKEKKDRKEKEKKKKDKNARSRDSDSDAEELNAMELDEFARAEVPADALVLFAQPLANQDQTETLLKAVKKASKNKTLKRGVKEVQKALRKNPSILPASSANADPIGVIVIAADISPMDVISHLPVLCEECNIPYVYVRSRAELGLAGNTKRATSVVMLLKERANLRRKKPDELDAEALSEDQEWPQTYKKVVKLALTAGETVLK